MLPRNDKYFAVTKDDGSFEIPNLPAGEEVEIQVWHERGAGPGGALVLPKKDLKWTPKGRFKVKLEARSDDWTWRWKCRRRRSIVDERAASVASSRSLQ